MSKLLVLFLVLVSTPALAAIDLGDGLVVARGTLEHGDNVLAVTQGDVRASLVPDLEIPDDIVDVWIKALPDKSAVDVSYVLNCQGKVKVRYTRSELLALIAYQKGDFEGALALTPDDPWARVGALRTLVAANKVDDALKLLDATPPRAQLAVAYRIRVDPLLAPLAEGAKRWATSRRKPTLPLYDPVRRLMLVSYWTGNAMAENAGGEGVVVLDADSGKRLFEGDDTLTTVAAELGFEQPLEYQPDTHEDKGKLAFELGGIRLIGGGRTRLKAGKTIIGDVKRETWHLEDGFPQTAAALFEDRVLVIGNYNIGDGCGAYLGSWFTVVPFENAPDDVQALAHAAEARRALAAKKPDEALALLVGDANITKAWRAIALSKAGKLDEARQLAMTLPELWGDLARTNPLADYGLRSGMRDPVGHADGPEGFDRQRGMVALPDPLHPGGTVFIDANGTTTSVVGLEATPEFMQRRGLENALGQVRPHKASQGEWRAVFQASAEMRIACGDDNKLAYVHAGERVGTGKCDARYWPDTVWFFWGAVGYVSMERVRIDDDESPERPTVRALVEPTR